MIKVDGLAPTSGSSSRIFSMTFPMCLPAAMNLNIVQNSETPSSVYQVSIAQLSLSWKYCIEDKWKRVLTRTISYRTVNNKIFSTRIAVSTFLN